MTPSSSGTSALALGLFAAGCAGQYAFGNYFSGVGGFAVGNDDAFIAYRYAANLVEHGVVSFNASDQPRVEGFSNPVHILLAALVFALGGANAVYPVMAAVGAAATAVAVALIVRRVQRDHGEVAGRALALALSLCPSLWIAATSGMETGVVFLLQVSLWLRVRDLPRHAALPLAAVAWAGLLSIARTDGFVFVAVVALWIGLVRSRRAAAALLATTLAGFLLTLAVRQAYYGEWMPTSVRAKVTGTTIDGLLVAGRLLGSLAYKNGFLAAFALVAAAVLWARPTRQGRDWPTCEAWCCVGMVGYYCLIGGDIYRERFLLLVLPMAWLIGVGLLGRTPRPRTVWLASSCIVAGQLAAFLLDPRLAWRFELPKHDAWITLGRHLGAEHPGATIAVSAAGKIPYFSRLEAIDTLGLNDKHIAGATPRNHIPGHSRMDPDYVFARRPDLIADHIVGHGDLVNGMPRREWSRHGYELYLLVRNDGTDGGIVDVRSLPSERVGELIGNGYDWGVLRRRAEPHEIPARPGR